MSKDDKAAHIVKWSAFILGVILAAHYISEFVSKF